MADLFDLDVPSAVRRIRAHDARVHVYLSTRLEQALEEAGEREGALAGVPYGLKDEFSTP